jgi:membrane associated rhomboid family serine protease
MSNSPTITPKIKFDTQQVIPIASLMLVFMFGINYVMAASHGPNLEKWLTNSCLMGVSASKSVDTAMSYLKLAFSGNGAAFVPVQQAFIDFITFCFNASFASLDVQQVAVNCFFMWAFGASLEQRIGAGRFFLVCMLGASLPWVMAYYEVVTRDPIHCYYGPFFMFCVLVGASFVFPPEKKINTEWFRSSRGNIFAKQEAVDFTTRYQFKPMLFLVLFIAYETGMYFYVGKSYPILKNALILSGIGAIFVGYLAVSVIVWSATGSLKDGPMRLMCVKMYNDILRLDVGHETAIKGTAHALGLPPERVKEWVAKQKGKLGVS